MSRSIFQSDSHLDVERRADFEGFDSQAVHIQERMLVCSTTALTSWQCVIAWRENAPAGCCFVETMAPAEARARDAHALEMRHAATVKRFTVLAQSFGDDPTTCSADRFFGDPGTFLATLSAARAQNERKRRVRDAADRRWAARAVRSLPWRKSDASRDTVATAVTALKNDTDNILAKLQGPRSRACGPTVVVELAWKRLHWDNGALPDVAYV